MVFNFSQTYKTIEVTFLREISQEVSAVIKLLKLVYNLLILNKLFFKTVLQITICNIITLYAYLRIERRLKEHEVGLLVKRESEKEKVRKSETVRK